MSSSGSDSGDEDYVPSDCGSQPPSEVESDGDEEDSDACNGGDSVKNGPKRKGKRGGRVDDDPSKQPKVKEENKEDTKQKSDSLWSDFLKDMSSDGGSSKGDSVSEKPEAKVEKKTITQVYEFAGEKVTVTKEVTAEAPSKLRKISPHADESGGNMVMKDNISLFTESEASVEIDGKIKNPVECVPKKSALGLSGKSRAIAKPVIKSGGSSLSSALDKLGKKNKLSTLEKSKLDWESYKNKEGISEEISSHNKGKSGYLDKQDFMEKTDLKQYELEKQFRNSQRRKL